MIRSQRVTERVFVFKENLIQLLRTLTEHDVTIGKIYVTPTFSFRTRMWSLWPRLRSQHQTTVLGISHELLVESRIRESIKGRGDIVFINWVHHKLQCCLES